MPTRTAKLPIALRRLNSEWNKDLPALLAWAKQAGFEAIDLNQAAPADVAAVRAAGLQLGSIDLIEMGKLLANDPGQREELIARNVAYVAELAAAGATRVFSGLIPGDPAKEPAG